MQKLLLGCLGLLVLYLAAANARLHSEGRLLEERLAAAQQKLLRTGAPTAPLELQPAPGAEAPGAAASLPPAGPGTASRREAVPASPKPAGKESAPATSPKPQPGPLQLAGKSLTFTLKNDQVTLVQVGGDEELGLTEAQQKAIDELRKNRETQCQAYADTIQRIEAETDLAIRQLLSPEQLAKYDAQRPAVVGATTFDPVEEPKTSTGLRQGYLGISGGDAEGGGARVTQVMPNTAASAFGLQQDDVILEFNGEAIPNLSALSSKIKESGEGSPAILRIRRGGNEFSQSIQLGAQSK
jgi:hypothetical protein